MQESNTMCVKQYQYSLHFTVSIITERFMTQLIKEHEFGRIIKRDAEHASLRDLISNFIVHN